MEERPMADLLMDMIRRRDERIAEVDKYLPKTLDTLSSRGPVQLENGNAMRLVEKGDHIKQGWDVAHENWIVVVETKRGDKHYFKIPVYYNSWDDGSLDAWEHDGAIVEVNKVPVTTYKWEEV